MVDLNRRGPTVDFGISAKWVVLIIVVVISVVMTIFLNNMRGQSDVEVVEGTIITDNGDLKINWERFSYYNVELADSLKITSSGVYHLTDSLSDGNIVVNVPDGKVKLILDNVSIKNSSGPAIMCVASDDLVIELVGKNVVEDGKTYASSYDEDVIGAIYSKDDLTFQGDGSLTVTANYQDGIVGKDDVKFNSGTYVISAVDDGIRGKDSVYIVGGDFTITAKADAIKSTNETTAGKGFVLIEKGTFAITAGAKGIKAINSILINDGEFVISSYDDAVHSNNYVGLVGGIFEISAGDDGVHADKKLVIENAEIAISKSYEGLEAQAITINGGNISITASDDGLNAGGGADNSAMNRPGAGAFDADTNCFLTINGGEIYVNASGDGVDSNGYIYFNGGSVIVDGPTNNGNGALDAGAGIVQNGGTVVAVGASGMAETLGSSSSIYNVSIYFSSNLPAKTMVEIKNSIGETIISHTSAKSFNHMSAGSSNFKSGERYTIYVNGEEYETFTISGITTTVGSGGNMMPGGAGGGGSQTIPGDIDGDNTQAVPGRPGRR